MTNYWLWLSVAGIGALHGLNPVAGWGFAAACGLRSGDRAQAFRALVPIGIGHVASIGLVAGAFAVGLSMDRMAMNIVAGGLLFVLAIHHLSGREAKQARVPAGTVGLALWSFMMSSAHGAGLMLVPVLMPLCAGNAATREVTASGSMMLAFAAVGVHTAAMLAVSGVIAIGVCYGFNARARLRWMREILGRP